MKLAASIVETNLPRRLSGRRRGRPTLSSKLEALNYYSYRSRARSVAHYNRVLNLALTPNATADLIEYLKSL